MTTTRCAAAPRGPSASIVDPETPDGQRVWKGRDLSLARHDQPVAKVSSSGRCNVGRNVGRNEARGASPRVCLMVGGVDGTRTRDPRRDRPGRQVNAGAALRPIQIPKTWNFVPLFTRRVIALFQRPRCEEAEERCLPKGLVLLTSVEPMTPWLVEKSPELHSVNSPPATGAFAYDWHALLTRRVRPSLQKVPIDFSTGRAFFEWPPTRVC